MTASRTIDGIGFDDDLSAIDAHENLWRVVLANAIEEAIRGPSSALVKTVQDCIYHIEQARNYVTRPNRDFNTVCSLAGLDPEAVRQRVTKQIAEAPSPETLANTKRGPNHRKPGVSSNFERSRGTGAGSTVQETPNITFSRNDA